MVLFRWPMDGWFTGAAAITSLLDVHSHGPGPAGRWFLRILRLSDHRAGRCSPVASLASAVRSSWTRWPWADLKRQTRESQLEILSLDKTSLMQVMDALFDTPMGALALLHRLAQLGVD